MFDEVQFCFACAFGVILNKSERKIYGWWLMKRDFKLIFIFGFPSSTNSTISYRSPGMIKKR